MTRMLRSLIREGRDNFYGDRFWTMAGLLAERFQEKGSSDWEHVREKLYFGIPRYLQDVFKN